MMLQIIVLEAFVTSVKWLCSLVSFQISHVSIVPTSRSLLASKDLACSTFSSIHFIFEAEKYGSIIRPVFCCIIS